MGRAGSGERKGEGEGSPRTPWTARAASAAHMFWSPRDVAGLLPARGIAHRPRALSQCPPAFHMQDIALLDARRGALMFRQVGVPVLGIVENMSYFVCGHCGGESHIFGQGGVQKAAADLHMPLLGQVSGLLSA